MSRIVDEDPFTRVFVTLSGECSLMKSAYVGLGNLTCYESRTPLFTHKV